MILKIVGFLCLAIPSIFLLFYSCQICCLIQDTVCRLSARYRYSDWRCLIWTWCFGWFPCWRVARGKIWIARRVGNWFANRGIGLLFFRCFSIEFLLVRNSLILAESGIVRFWGKVECSNASSLSYLPSQRWSEYFFILFLVCERRKKGCRLLWMPSEKHKRQPER